LRELPSVFAPGDNARMDAAPLRVGIVPTHEYTRRRRLWSALQAAYPVRFEGREPGAVAGLDGLIAIGGSAVSPCDDIPCLLAEGEERPQTGTPPLPLLLSSDPALPPPLAGARLSESRCTALTRPALEQEVVLATLDGAPAWTRARGGASPTQRIACVPEELGEHEALRERLEPGRCLALLALVQFLRDLTAAPASARLHATFLIDDPNLHWRSYGHLRYPELLRDARTHGYHLAVAMVPLDGWLADPRVARLFREGERQLSVCVHGNEHYGPELGRPRTVAEGIALGKRALRRVAAFERRTGVAVDRVMVPPHERISEPMARALVACGFQALSTTRPYPWAVTSPDRPWLTRPADAGPLAAWRPVDIVAGGLPVLLRADFALHPREDLVLRAFLGQPLILYGHHELLRDGPDALAQTAAEIDRLGEVHWCSLAEIPRPRVVRGTLGATAASETTEASGARTTSETTGVSGATATSEATEVSGATAASEASALGATGLDASTIPPLPRRLRPVLRRVAAEGEVRLRAAVTSRKDRQ